MIRNLDSPAVAWDRPVYIDFENFQEVCWVEDGMDVWVPTERTEKGYRLHRCKVLVAAGEHARIVSEGIDTWRHINQLYVRKDDPHALVGGGIDFNKLFKEGS